MIQVKIKGDWSDTTNYLQQIKQLAFFKIIEEYAKTGVEVLSKATPKDTGVTADSWHYTIRKTSTSVTVEWTNSSVTDTGIPIVVLLKYGHSMPNGGYYKGYNFIDPAIKPVMDDLLKNVWISLTSEKILKNGHKIKSLWKEVMGE